MMYIGQKVVCINDIFTSPDWDAVPIKPVRNKVYTVRGFHTERYFEGLYLMEVINDVTMWRDHGDPWISVHEMSFWVGRFRPVTDISALTKLSKVRELEDA